MFQETAARDGLMKMKTVYEANPALGDPMSIQVNRVSYRRTGGGVWDNPSPHPPQGAGDTK